MGWGPSAGVLGLFVVFLAWAFVVRVSFKLKALKKKRRRRAGGELPRKGQLTSRLTLFSLIP